MPRPPGLLSVPAASELSICDADADMCRSRLGAEVCGSCISPSCSIQSLDVPHLSQSFILLSSILRAAMVTAARPRGPLIDQPGLPDLRRACHLSMSDTRGETSANPDIRHEPLACSTTLGYAASIVICAPFSPFNTHVTHTVRHSVRAAA